MTTTSAVPARPKTSSEARVPTARPELQASDKELIRAAKTQLNFKAGQLFFTADGKSIKTTEGGKFNLVINTKTGKTYKFIGNQLVFESGGLGKVPASLTKPPFSKHTEANIFIDSPDSSSRSNGVILIRSKASTLREESDSSIIVDSPNHWGREASHNIVVNSPHLKIRLSHYCEAADSGGSKDKAAVIDNSDKVKLLGSQGSHVESCDHLTVVNSPKLKAVFCSSETVIKGSAGANLNGANASKIIESPKAKTTGSTEINLSNCAKARIFHSNEVQAKNAPEAHITHSERTEITDSEFVRIFGSYLTKVIRSDGVLIDRSEKANIKDSPTTELVTSPGYTVINSPETKVNNSDDSIIKNSARTRTKDASKLRITDSPDTKVQDALEAEVTRSANSHIESSPLSKVIDSPNSTVIGEMEGREVINQPGYKSATQEGKKPTGKYAQTAA